MITLFVAYANQIAKLDAEITKAEKEKRYYLVDALAAIQHDLYERMAHPCGRRTEDLDDFPF